MKVLLQRDCLGGERVVEIELPRPVALGDLDRLENVTRREVLDHLPRPFFRIDVAGQFLLTGILFSPHVRFTVRLARRESAREVAIAAAKRLVNVA